MSEAPEVLPDELVVHRVGGASIADLSLKPSETTLKPPGFSLLCGGSAAEAAEAMRRQFPRMAPRGQTVVGSTTVGQVRAAGFDVRKNATVRFPQHARLVHPNGLTGFTTVNIQLLTQCFAETAGL